MSERFAPSRFRREDAPEWLRRFCPHETVGNVADVDPDALKARGIAAVLLDLDNTLTPWRSYDAPDEIVDWIKRMQEAGFKMCLTSNTRRRSRLIELSERFAIPYALGPMKPRKGILRNALEMLGAKPSEAAIIGDQMFTDVWGGNRLGLYTIWVRPLHHKEFIGTKISRMVENWLVKRLEPYRERI